MDDAAVNAHVKTLLTMAVLAVLVVLGVTWGWASLTKPLPHRAASKVCYPTKLQPGDRVSAPKVTVSVYNASTRVGLAERTMSAFEDQGFGPGAVGNAPKGTVVHYAQIWTSDPKNPAVLLVASRLGRHAGIVDKKHRGPGVVVMVGRQFGHLVQGRQSTKVTRPTTICSPPTT
jgi:LytR cell envelope-related transcriptional attenuator